MGHLLGRNSGLVGGPAKRGGAFWDALRRGVANRSLVAGLLVGVPALALYWRTLMPDVGFWDTGEFQAIGPVLGIAHPTGYPAYTMLAWLASVVLQPFGNEAFRANLLSAIVAAIASGLVAASVTRVTRRLVVGVAAGIALAVSVEAWSIGLRADPHALHLMLAAALLLLLVVWQDRIKAGASADRWLFAAAVTFGISLANHGLTLLLAPGIAIFVLAADPAILRRPRLIMACAAGLAFTTVALYAYLPIRSAMNPPLDYANPETWDGFRYLVFAEQFRGTFRALPDVFEALRTIGGETVTQLGVFAPLAIVGVLAATWRRPAMMLLLATWFVVNWFFALGYINADIGRYYLVPLLVAAVFGGIGAGAIVDLLASLWSRSSGPDSAGESAAEPQGDQPTTRKRAVHVSGYAVAALAAVALITPSVLSVTDRFSRVDASNDFLARRWLTTVTARLPENAVVVSWWSYSTTLWYGKYVDHLRPDVTVIDDSTIVQENLGSAAAVIDSYLGQRPVFLIRLSFDLPQFEQRYVLTLLTGRSRRPGLPRRWDAGDLGTSVGPMMPAVAEMTDTGPARPRVPRAVVLLPRAQRGREHRGSRRRGARGAANVWPTSSRSSPWTTAARTTPPRLADELAAAHPQVRVVHHAGNKGYGAALRSGFRAARYDLVCFLDGDRQFRVEDLGRLIERMSRAGQSRRRRRLPHQARRSGHPPRLRPGLPAGAADLLPTRRQGRGLRLQVVPARRSRGNSARVGRRILVRGAADQAAPARPAAGRDRACRTTRAWRARRRVPTRRSCCALSATSGDCVFGYGSTEKRRWSAASQSWRPSQSLER